MNFMNMHMKIEIFNEMLNECVKTLISVNLSSHVISDKRSNA